MNRWEPAEREEEEETVAKGCFQSKHTPRLWPHKIWKISFARIVDGIRVVCENEEDALHLISQQHHRHPVKSDWKGEGQAGTNSEWDCDKRELTTSVKGYVKKALHPFQHDAPSRPIHSPSKREPPSHSRKKMQFAPADKDSRRTTRTERHSTFIKFVGSSCAMQQ